MSKPKCSCYTDALPKYIPRIQVEDYREDVERLLSSLPPPKKNTAYSLGSRALLSKASFYSEEDTRKVLSLDQLSTSLDQLGSTFHSLRGPSVQINSSYCLIGSGIYSGKRVPVNYYSNSPYLRTKLQFVLSLLDSIEKELQFSMDLDHAQYAGIAYNDPSYIASRELLFTSEEEEESTS